MIWFNILIGTNQIQTHFFDDYLYSQELMLWLLWSACTVAEKNAKILDTKKWEASNSIK